jgi:hypothetical protein
MLPPDRKSMAGPADETGLSRGHARHRSGLFRKLISNQKYKPKKGETANETKNKTKNETKLQANWLPSEKMAKLIHTY